MLDAADTSAAVDVRLAAFRTLLDSVCARPIPAPRWRALKNRMTHELANRAAAEGRSPSDILGLEIESAIALRLENAKNRLNAATSNAESRRDAAQSGAQLFGGIIAHALGGLDTMVSQSTIET